MSKHEEFLALYEPQQERLERFVLYLTRNRETARDVVGETVLIAYENFEKMHDRQAFLSFLFTIASRVFKNSREHNERFKKAEAQDIGELLCTRDSPETLADVQFLHEAIHRLPEDYREAIILAEIMGFSHKEIAEIQNARVAGVKVRIFRAKQKLRAMLLPKEKSPAFKNSFNTRKIL
jgi:RNA polymerase sigma-70 factor (ECF subfamily)